MLLTSFIFLLCFLSVLSTVASLEISNFSMFLLIQFEQLTAFYRKLNNNKKTLDLLAQVFFFFFFFDVFSFFCAGPIFPLASFFFCLRASSGTPSSINLYVIKFSFDICTKFFLFHLKFLKYLSLYLELFFSSVNILKVLASCPLTFIVSARVWLLFLALFHTIVLFDSDCF